uniref:Cysteine-rich RLK (Receptor-like protein kinase) 8 n=1 Tax=Tanacetum cinerariifolium TaxID=118510 RepID=A0A699HAF1_TANCI|nr:cysteine-rich RLK (receptor-like protein kinase) 8 [Tanacetum cinerariifolium]
MGCKKAFEIYQHLKKSSKKSILMIDPLPSVEVACSLLQQEESQRLMFKSSVGIKSTALLSKWIVKDKCSICGFKWHAPDKCWEKDLTTKKVTGLGSMKEGLYHLVNVTHDKIDFVFSKLVQDSMQKFSLSALGSLKFENKALKYSYRGTWLYLLDKKSDAFLAFKSFIKFVATHFEKQVKIVRSDNALEFVRGQCGPYLESQVVSNPSKIADKFDPRGIPYVFLGYPTNQKGYKFYNLITHATFVSRDDVFHETVSEPAQTSTAIHGSQLLLGTHKVLIIYEISTIVPYGEIVRSSVFSEVTIIIDLMSLSNS